MNLIHIIKRPFSFFGATRLRLEITFLILIKLLLVYVLWLVCFSHPVQSHITTQVLQQHILN